MKNGWIAIALAALVVTGCSGIQVNQDYDPATNFGSLKTYRWASKNQPKTGDLRLDNPLRDQRIRAAVERRLADQGFIRSMEGPPTFLVRYQYTLGRIIEADGAGGGIGFGIGSFGRGGGIAIGSGTGYGVREYDQSSLTIDFIDPGSETLLWRGTGSQRFKAYDDPAKATADINTLVETVLAQFPPRT
jgi:hypothetical protein